MQEHLKLERVKDYNQNTMFLDRDHKYTGIHINKTSHQERRQRHKRFCGVVLYQDTMHNSVTYRSEAFGPASCSALHAS